MASSNVSDGLMAELSLKESTLKKHSVLLFDSSSDSDGEGNERKTTETNNEGVSSNEFLTHSITNSQKRMLDTE